MLLKVPILLKMAVYPSKQPAWCQWGDPKQSQSPRTVVTSSFCVEPGGQIGARQALQKPKGCPQVGLILVRAPPESENIQKFEGCPQVLSKSVRVQKLNT